MAKTMYCFPSCMNVIGIAVVVFGIRTEPTVFPVALSTAQRRALLPRSDGAAERPLP